MLKNKFTAQRRIYLSTDLPGRKSTKISFFKSGYQFAVVVD